MGASGMVLIARRVCPVSAFEFTTRRHGSGRVWDGHLNDRHGEKIEGHAIAGRAGYEKTTCRAKTERFKQAARSCID